MMDLYVMATELLAIVSGQLNGFGITLPAIQYVAPGPMPAWDGEQITCHLVRSYEGSPISEANFQMAGYAEHAAEFSICIVRATPVMTDLGIAPTPAQVRASVIANMTDVAGLIRALETIKNKGLWVDHATPFSIGPVLTQGPEGGLVAVVGSLQVGVY